ncbi:LysR family transcriptional regulator [Clostridium sp. BJN0001]|uniref:LysR family transcriptional regulator n=1 Tax=Clostridium sp. BJN0001 TaxID=2930219 RepID=UPI001FD46291|nr:LysR family transcriptional regulator [Clostridium sp. BJN0001]
MLTKYDAFIKVIETGSFTKAADQIGYTQSAVSQMISSLESTLNTKLISRTKKSIILTPDGKEYLPFIKNIRNAELELLEKKKEMQGLQSGIIRIGTFSSVSCNWLPLLIKKFKKKYPYVHFHLMQGEYTNVDNWVKDGSVDFGFINPSAASKDLTVINLRDDEMLAVLPKEHKLCKKRKITLDDISKEPYILLDEGDISEPLQVFKEKNLSPNIEYKVYDDYTIMSMVENGLGVSILSNLVLKNHHQKIITKSISPKVVRTIGLVYKNKNILPIAGRYFINFIINEFNSKQDF